MGLLADISWTVYTKSNYPFLAVRRKPFLKAQLLRETPGYRPTLDYALGHQCQELGAPAMSPPPQLCSGGGAMVNPVGPRVLSGPYLRVWGRGDDSGRIWRSGRWVGGGGGYM